MVIDGYRWLYMVIYGYIWLYNVIEVIDGYTMLYGHKAWKKIAYNS